MAWEDAFAGLGAGLTAGVGAYLQGEQLDLANRRADQTLDIANQRMALAQFLQQMRGGQAMEQIGARGDEARQTLGTKSGMDIALEDTRQGGRKELAGLNWDRRDTEQSRSLENNNWQFGHTFEEAVRSHQASENLRRMAIEMQKYGIDIGAEMRKLGYDTSRQNNADTNATSTANNERSNATSRANNALTNKTREKVGGGAAFWGPPAPAPVPDVTAAPEPDETVPAIEPPADPVAPVPEPQAAAPSPIEQQMMTLAAQYRAAKTKTEKAAIAVKLAALRAQVQ